MSHGGSGKVYVPERVGFVNGATGQWEVHVRATVGLDLTHCRLNWRGRRGRVVGPDHAPTCTECQSELDRCADARRP